MIEPHDLLKIDPKNLISYSPIPAWAIQSLRIAPYVVVRRANTPKGKIAIGIRGRARSERFGAFIPEDAIIHQIKPENLTDTKLWENKQSPVFSSLKIAREILDKYKLVWGPGGSAGFELAAEVRAVTSESDLDIVLRTPNPISVNQAASITKDLQDCPARVDIQAETPFGAISLMEYAKGSSLLLKTKNGPLLCDNPWKVQLVESCK